MYVRKGKKTGESKYMIGPLFFSYIIVTKVNWTLTVSKRGGSSWSTSPRRLQDRYIDTYYAFGV